MDANSLKALDDLSDALEHNDVATIEDQLERFANALGLAIHLLKLTDGAIRTLTSAGSFELDGRTVYTFKGIKGFDPRTLNREWVTIDGKKHKVIGVETNCVIDPSGMDFGLKVIKAE